MPYSDTAIDLTTLLGAHSDAEELYRAGLARATGLDTEIDLIEAHKWFNLAAAKGHDEARIQRQEVSDMMSSTEVKSALEGARAWLRLSN